MSLTFSDISTWFLIAVAVVFISNFIKYKGRLKNFDWFVLVLIVALNVSFLMLSFFDPYTFGLLWKKFFVLTVAAVIINVLLNKVIQDRLEEKDEAVNWREDRKFMISLSVVSAVFIVGFISYSIWYTTPRDVNQTIEGIQFQLGEESVEKPVTIKINGELSRSLSGGGIYGGKFVITGEDVQIPSEDSGVTIDYRGQKNGILLYRNYQPGRHETVGTIVVNNQFEEIAIMLYNHGSWSSEDGQIISAPANNRKEALELARELTGYELK
ncbi:hypothetical protein [Filobacillus milosensis]|uniref:hypothetical protein n=1 Tax=Filobacillus milosensis TaxID=94137 RepID=UPI001069943B|nr:hypothetical protein [Filobacillus milosensis]